MAGQRNLRLSLTSTRMANSTSCRPRARNEGPHWTKRTIRTIPVKNGYVDSFSDLPLDVDQDGSGRPDRYFARRIVWMLNPGKARWRVTEHLIDAIGPTEFAFLVDLDNDGKADDLLPQFTGAAEAPLTWYDLKDGVWPSAQSARELRHANSAGDVNDDERNDNLTPQGLRTTLADPTAAGI